MPGGHRNSVAFTVVVSRLALAGGVLMLLLIALSGAPDILLLAAALTDATERGLLPASDIPWLVDLGSRRRIRRVVRSQGDGASAALSDHQRAAIELGFLQHRYLRGTPPDDFAARGQAYVARIQAARPYFSFPGQVVLAR